MVKEDYVSFETAKLLKEKGFNETCDNYYDQSSDEPQQLTLDEMYYSYDEFIKAPTLQMAMKWLREVHNIAMNIGWGEIFENKFQWWCIILNIKDGSILRESEYCATYEEAVEAAIKYCLKNLI